MDELELQGKFKSKKVIISFIVFAVILVTLPVTLFLSQKTQIFKSKADNTLFSCPKIDIVSTDVVDLSALALNKINPEEQKAIEGNLQNNEDEVVSAVRDKNAFFANSEAVVRFRTKLIERKNLMLQAMRQKPEAAWANLANDATGRNIASGTQDCVEKETTLEGRVEISHADFFEEKTSSVLVTLITDDDQRYKLYRTGIPKILLKSGMRVRITGYLLENSLLYNGEDEKSVTVLDPNLTANLNSKENNNKNVLGAQTESPTVGHQKVAVIFSTFDDSPKPQFTIEEAKTQVFPRVKDFYHQISYGKLDFDFDYYGFYSVSMDKEGRRNTATAPIIKAADSDINFNDYKYIIMVAPWDSYPGISTSGPVLVHTDDGDIRSAIAWIQIGFFDNLAKYPAIRDNVARLIEHELGHGLGLGHASSLSCGSETFSNTCRKQENQKEYGDNFDIMGSGYGDFNAAFKDQIGWLEPSDIETVNSSGTFDLKPIESGLKGVKALKIPRIHNSYLYIEYRQPLGVDFNLGKVNGHITDVFEGALLRLFPAVFILPNGNFQSLLLDASPPAELNGMYTPTLLPGKSFTDPDTGNIIKVVEKKEDSLIVSVILGTNSLPDPPEIFSGDVNTSFDPWVIWLTGKNLNGKLSAQVFGWDKVKWENDLPVDVSADGTWLSFQLTSNQLPSNCNKDQTCVITVSIYNQNTKRFSNELSVNIPPYKPKIEVVITKGGVATSYSPWVAWFQGQGLKPGLLVQLEDNGIKWGEDLPITLSEDRSWLSVQLPGKTPPSGCNIGKNCYVTAKLSDKSTGQFSNELMLNLPATNENTPVPATPSPLPTPTSPPSPVISNAGTNTSYNPWVVWVAGTNLNKDLLVKVYDSGTQWGEDLTFTLSADGTWGSFQLPANIPPSKCNVGRECAVEIKLYQSNGTLSNGFSLNLPQSQ